MQLRRFAAQRRHADGVLEQPARVGVMRLGRRQRPQQRAQRLVRHEPPNGCTQARVRDLGGQELEEAVQL
jgi:hypothetical protein